MVEHATTCPIAQGTGTDCRCRGVVDAHEGYAAAGCVLTDVSGCDAKPSSDGEWPVFVTEYDEETGRVSLRRVEPSSQQADASASHAFSGRLETLRNYCDRRDIPCEWKLRDALHLLADIDESLRRQAARRAPGGGGSER